MTQTTYDKDTMKRWLLLLLLLLLPLGQDEVKSIKYRWCGRVPDISSQRETETETEIE